MLERSLVFLLALQAGCASFTSQTQILESPAGIRHIDRVIPGSRTYRATAEVDGIQLVVTLATQERCEQAEVPLVRRVRVTTKTEVPSLVGLRGEILAAVATVLVGGAMIGAPERACAWDSDDGTRTEIDPATCTAGGWGLVSLGGVLTAAAIADTVQGRDEREDLGIQESTYERTERVCHAQPAARSDVALQLGGATPALRGRTSDAGVATFSLDDVASDALPSPVHPAQLAIGTDTTLVDVTDAQHRALSANLLAAAGSQLFREHAATTQAACATAIDEAQQHTIQRDSDDAAIGAAQIAWHQASASCATRWTASDQASYADAARAIATNRIGVVVRALTTGDLDRVDQVLAAEPTLIAQLADAPDVLPRLRRLLGESTRALVRPTDLAQARQRFCRVRRSFIAIHDEAAWRVLEPKIAQNVGDLEQRSPAEIVRRMRDAGCGP